MAFGKTMADKCCSMLSWLEQLVQLLHAIFALKSAACRNSGEMWGKSHFAGFYEVSQWLTRHCKHGEECCAPPLLDDILVGESLVVQPPSMPFKPGANHRTRRSHR